MTREEALEELKEIRFNLNYKVNGTSRFDEALDMAIKALQQEPKSEEEAYSFPEVFGEPIEILVDGVWVKGKVINDYRSRDGIVNMETADGKKYWCGCERTDCYRRPKEGIVANGELYPGEFDNPLAAEGSDKE